MARRIAGTRPEIWGGVEATVNRIGDIFRDQIVLTGHDSRPQDLDAIAALGIRTLRYPILWERTAVAAGVYDWAWADDRMARLAALEIDPIVGLVHHGSGPRWTNLLQDDFVSGLVDFAEAVASRYPHVRRFTIVNEPLTTARFAGLYGLWYPHATDDRAFVRALLNQCRATVLAMDAIRARTPDAELVQTEDMGRTFSRPAAAEQARFYNERRWLSFDLLCGRVVPGHSMWQYLRESGATESELDFFAAGATPPDILGINYYITSDRFLDERTALFPEQRGHTSGALSFVDLDAVRSPAGIAGHRQILEDVWQRYNLPMAITEVHLGCTGDEQVRWLFEAWDAACDACADGMPIRAVTPWALLGSVDWDSLLVEQHGHYEPGAFDVRAGEPRRTAVADAIAEIASVPLDRQSATSAWWRQDAAARCSAASLA